MCRLYKQYGTPRERLTLDRMMYKEIRDIQFCVSVYCEVIFVKLCMHTYELNLRGMNSDKFYTYIYVHVITDMVHVQHVTLHCGQLLVHNFVISHEPFG